jgi:hypothetical protein
MDGTPVSGSWTGAKVMAVEDAPSDTCGALDYAGRSGGPQGRRFSIQTVDGAMIALYARLPGMPADLLKAGDAIDLAADATKDPIPFTVVPAQTFTVKRSGALVLFGLHRATLPGTHPLLGAAGVAIGEAGAACFAPSIGCSVERFLARIDAGTDWAVVPSGQSARVGPFSVTVQTFETDVGGNCDGSPRAQLAGFGLGL